MTGTTKACSLAFVCALAAVVAQQLGSVAGVVTDSAGGVIPSADVRLYSSNTGFDRKSTTDVQGHYQFLGVPSGTYELSIVSSGFKLYKRNVSISAGVTVSTYVVKFLPKMAEC